MKTLRKPSHISKADWDSVDVPELTVTELATARPLREAMPDLAEWSRRRRAKKGEERKRAVSLRLSPEVIDYFKSGGAGWQTRIDRTLLSIVESLR